MKQLLALFCYLCILMLNYACKKDKTENPVSVSSDCKINSIQQDSYKILFSYQDSLLKQIDEISDGTDSSGSLSIQYNSLKDIEKLTFRSPKSGMNKGRNEVLILNYNQGHYTQFERWTTVDGEARMLEWITDVEYDSQGNIKQFLYRAVNDTLGKVEITYNKPGNIETITIFYYKNGSFFHNDCYRFKTNGKAMDVPYLG